MLLDSVLGIIPARYASTRFPGKPLVDIGGKPMIQRVYEQAAKILKHVYVATDDERIFDAVLSFNGKVVMTSPEHQSGTDRCTEALSLVESEEKRSYDVVINIQGDEPFIEPEILETLTGCFMSSMTEIATLVKPLKEAEDLFDSNKPKVVINPKYEAIYFSRSPIPYLRQYPQKEWHLKHPYFLHIGLYGYRSDILREITSLKPSSLELAESLEQLRWLENGYKISVRTVNHETIGIDTPEDLERVKKSGLIS
ncbi:3-deoxy-manno-octulosonate cytidylyltransferase [Alkalitalea saponilacus]|uniref:3-deoxy-manno-octulosonate cytidylyltransferase n=1 Tax=Alkalitalea saponilacus TaxID=889453 RepID=A0A1T5FTK7_9BACT|nr:3-deoxy-manno-octulosonate cytidylyltransferase [Alkalitalea saponilacus]ASB49488.1 3-deoxy-manno-octulosonate cytidylyltransferase [Alkalitalea saponilacus]SKB99427.1 3-deoxy-manno-octulosonate cytidylyltransferase (CMP-KDO synthetase) [Alkalitalea saponilacus]